MKYLLLIAISINSLFFIQCANKSDDTGKHSVSLGDSAAETYVQVLPDSNEIDMETVQIEASVSVMTTKTSKEKDALQHFFGENRSLNQVFTFNSERENTVYGKEKITVHIPKNAFCHQDGTPFNGKVKLEIREYNTLESILMGNLNTEAPNAMLETGGMYFIKASHEGNELKIRENKSLEIGVSTMEIKEGMELFYGSESADKDLEWRRAWFANRKMSSGFKDFRSEVTNFPRCYMCTDFIHNNIKLPKRPLPNTGANICFVSAKIGMDGKVISASMFKGIGGGFDEAILQVINKMDNWIPPARGTNGISFQVMIPVVLIQEKVIKVMTLKQFEATEEQYRKYLDIKEEYATRNPEVDIISKLETLNTENIVAMESYVLQTSELGWINIDRLIDIKPEDKYGIIVNKSSGWNREENIKLIFTSYRSILGGFMTGVKYNFDNIPRGEKAFLFGTRINNNQPEFAFQEITIGNNPSYQMEYRKFTKDDVLDLIRRMSIKQVS